MENSKCDFLGKFERSDSFFECERCGNHVCKTQAEVWGRVCPHCFGRLLRIS